MSKFDLAQQYRLRVFQLVSNAEVLIGFVPGDAVYDKVGHDVLDSPFWRGSDDRDHGQGKKFKAGDGFGGDVLPCDDDVDDPPSDMDPGDASDDGGSAGEVCEQDAEDIFGESDDDGHDIGGANVAIAAAGEQPGNGSGMLEAAPALPTGGPGIAVAAAARRQYDVVRFVVQCGEIRFWPASQRFGAFSHDPRHRSEAVCRKEKRSGTSARNPGQGRPLGYLMAWSQRHGEWESAREHMDNSFIIPMPDRQVGREMLASLSGSRVLFERERPKVAADEPDEPTEHP